MPFDPKPLSWMDIRPSIPIRDPRPFWEIADELHRRVLSLPPVPPLRHTSFNISSSSSRRENEEERRTAERRIANESRREEEERRREREFERKAFDEALREYRQQQAETARTCSRCGGEHHNNATLCTSCFREKFGIG